MMKQLRVLAACGAALSLFHSTGCNNPSSSTPVEVRETYKHERPAWSPSGLKIAFTVRTQDSAGIYIVDTTGANLHMIKAGAGVGITWSPDSRWLAFSISGSLFKMLENGDSLTQLTNNASDYRPSWSPDGKKIVYVNAGLRALNLQDSTTMNLVPYGEYPSWHSNSTDILFLVFAQTGSSRYYNEFRTISLADSTETVQFAFASDALAGFCSFNNDGTEILMSVKPPDYSGLSQIIVASLVDISISQRTADGGDYPAYSPDGKKIVYMRSADGDGGLWIMNSDGTGKHRLTTP